MRAAEQEEKEEEKEEEEEEEEIDSLPTNSSCTYVQWHDLATWATTTNCSDKNMVVMVIYNMLSRWNIMY